MLGGQPVADGSGPGGRFGSLTWVVVLLGISVWSTEQVGLANLLAALAGFGIATAYVVPWSMISDVLEYDQVRSVQRREGSYYAFASFFQKLATGAALWGMGQTLALTGYIKPMIRAATPQYSPQKRYKPFATSLAQSRPSCFSPRSSLLGAIRSAGKVTRRQLLFTLLNAGDHLIASEVCYAGLVELLGKHLPRFGVEVSLVDTSDHAQVQSALRSNTKLIYVETPANLVLRIADIAKLAAIAHQAGAEMAVDSTWATPSLQNPWHLAPTTSFTA